MIQRTVAKGLVRVNGKYYKQLDPLENMDGDKLRFVRTDDAILLHQLDKTGLKIVGFWHIVNSPNN